ncbi:MAG TPA: hypothetical protein VIF62_38660 [Labilithrix sp.]
MRPTQTMIPGMTKSSSPMSVTRFVRRFTTNTRRNQRPPPNASAKDGLTPRATLSAMSMRPAWTNAAIAHAMTFIARLKSGFVAPRGNQCSDSAA